MLHIQRDDEFRAREQRARTILHRLKSCHRMTASPRACNPAETGARSNYTRGAGEPKLRQDWMASVFNALRCGAGTQGTRVLVAILTRQQKSQASGFRTVAMQTGMSEGDTEFVFYAALSGFLDWMDGRNPAHERIPDDYRPEDEMPVIVHRRGRRTESVKAA